MKRTSFGFWVVCKNQRLLISKKVPKTGKSWLDSKIVTQPCFIQYPIEFHMPSWKLLIKSLRKTILVRLKDVQCSWFLNACNFFYTNFYRSFGLVFYSAQMLKNVFKQLAAATVSDIFILIPYDYNLCCFLLLLSKNCFHPILLSCGKLLQTMRIDWKNDFFFLFKKALCFWSTVSSRRNGNGLQYLTHISHQPFFGFCFLAKCHKFVSIPEIMHYTYIMSFGKQC